MSHSSPPQYGSVAFISATPPSVLVGIIPVSVLVGIIPVSLPNINHRASVARLLEELFKPSEFWLRSAKFQDLAELEIFSIQVIFKTEE